MQLIVKVPRTLCLKNLISNKYSQLYREYRRYYPNKKDYTYRRLRRNIAEVATIVSATIDSDSIHTSSFTPWLDNGWKQFYFKHWYFALTIETMNDTSIALIHDAHYEGDHHNDILLSKPYDIEDTEENT